MKKKKEKTESEKALDEFFKQYVEQKREEGITGLALGADFNEMFKGLQKRFYEAALEGEMEHHLGYKKGEKNNDSNNIRNGKTPRLCLQNGDLIQSIAEQNIMNPMKEEGVWSYLVETPLNSFIQQK